MWSDPISDMLTRMRNAARVRKTHALIPCSKIKIGIANVLRDEGFITVNTLDFFKSRFGHKVAKFNC